MMEEASFWQKWQTKFNPYVFMNIRVVEFKKKQVIE